jgi:D-psicose/D-tagatose/L-ribulose 3-epimerase
VVSKALSDNLCIWRNMWSDSGDLARHAHSYMQAQLQAAHAAARQASSAHPQM